MKATRIILAAIILIGAVDAFAQPARPGAAARGAVGAAVDAAVPAAPVIVPVLGAGRGQIVLTWDEFVKITGYDPANKGQQVLTIPWREVEQLLGVELKGRVPMNQAMVDLPWKDFMSLLEWSVRKKADAAAPPPAEYVISSARYEGVLGADQVNFTLALKLNILRQGGWKRIPILPASVAVTETTLGEGVYLHAQGNVYELMTEKTGALDVTVKFVVQVNKTSGISSVTFDRVLGGSATLDLTTEDELTQVKVAGAQSLVTRAADKKVAVALAAGGPVAITWERVLRKAAAAPPKLYAESATLVSVAEGVLVCQASVNLNILHSPIRELKLTVPKEASILDVTGTNIQDWRTENDQLAVTFRGEVVGSYALRVSYEAPAAATADVPLIRPTGVEREKGFVGVVALANVEIEPATTTTATKIDVQQLPAELSAMTRQPILLGFRYVGQDAKISLQVKRHAEVQVLVTIADSALATIMQLEDGRRMTRIIYNVRNNRNQFLRVHLAEGAQLWSASVGGNTVLPGSDAKNPQVLLVPLIRSSAAAQELASFPVELVYVETPGGPVPAEGKLTVNLPTLEEAPIVHVMVNYYAPAQGKYGRPAGLFGGGESGFDGTLKLVDNFATMATDAAAGKVVKADLPKQAQQMQQQFEQQIEQRAKAAGATPIRVRLPVDGQLFRLEKILALPGDKLFFTVSYSNWKK